MTFPNSRSFNALIICTLLVILMVGFKAMAGILAPLAFAFFFVLLLYPILVWLMNKGVPKFWAVMIMTAGVIIVVGGLLIIITMSLGDLIANWDKYAAGFDEHMKNLSGLLDRLHITVGATSVEGKSYLGSALSFFGSLIGNVTYLSMFLFMILMLFIDAPFFTSVFTKYMPPDRTFVVRFSTYQRMLVKQTLIQTANNLATCTCTYILLRILHVDYALLWATILFVISFVPKIGYPIGMFLASFMTFVMYGLETALIFATIAVSIGAFLDNVVFPQFMGVGLSMPVSLVLMSFFVWSWVFGPLGALIAVPATLGIRAVLGSFDETKLAYYFMGGVDPDSAPTLGKKSLSLSRLSKKEA